MKPVFQTNYGKHKGNCLTACVASILEVPIEALPEFCVDNKWFDLLNSFCEENGFMLMYWPHTEKNPILCLNTYLIIVLELEGDDDFHAVVGKTVLESKVLVTDRDVENNAELEDMIGSRRSGDTNWSWKAELVHDPNQHGYPPVKGVKGYVLIAKQ